jgi:hypothetical protein
LRVTVDSQKKRIVIWGTGFVGKMVIAEIVKHPLFELVGVGVSNLDKVGRDPPPRTPTRTSACGPVPSGGHRRLFDRHDAVGVADDAPQPAELDRTHRRGL